MKNLFKTIRSASIYLMAFSLLLAVSAACNKDDIPDGEQVIIEEFIVQTEDELSVVSDLPAYVYPHNYEGFGSALKNRLSNQVPAFSLENVESIATIVVHSSKLNTMGDDFGHLVGQLLMGNNVVIIEPTLETFRYFCKETTDLLQELIKVDDEFELDIEVDLYPGLRQIFAGFYEMSEDDSKIESLFLSKSDSQGIFAEAIAVRGCEFHVVDRMVEVSEVETTIETLDTLTNTTVPFDDPQVEIPEGGIQSDIITPYAYGLFADVFTEWINEQEYYQDKMEEMRTRGANMLQSRAGTTQYDLKDISAVQKVEYTFKASSPLSSSNPIPVKVSFEISSVHMQGNDYYCIYKKVISYNQNLNCGPTEFRTWREDDYIDNSHYYGPFMRKIRTSSICHKDSRYASSDGMIQIPNNVSVSSVPNATIEKYSPTNSSGSTTESTGISYGFSGAICYSEKPSINLGFNFGWNSSNLRSVNDLQIEASTYNGKASWNYVGQNLPEAFYNLVKTNSHSFAPEILRTECLVDQSWILKIPNASGSYSLLDQTEVTTSIMYYTTEFFECETHYMNNATEKRVSFLLLPPPRYVQKWTMHVEQTDAGEGVSKIDQETLEEEIQTMHPDFWDESGAELELPDASMESRVSITEFMNKFKRQLNNKYTSWERKNLFGTFTFTFINDDNNDEYRFRFQVEETFD